MIRFECDYGEGAAQPVLDLLQKTNLEQTPGYGEDEYCEQARALIRRLCVAPTKKCTPVCGAQALAGRSVRGQRAHPCARDRRR